MGKVDIVKQFESELKKNVAEMKKIRPFNRLQQLLDEYGYFEGARILINREETSGLRELFLAGKQDISIESLALSEKFKSLFTEDELKKCSEKLPNLTKK